MPEWLNSIDVALFRFGNEALSNPLFDVIFPFITEIRSMAIPYAVALLSVMILFKKRGIVAVVLAVIAVGIGDQLNSFALKPLFERMRPCATLEGVRLLVDCGAGKSFPSSHAVNNFAAACVFALRFPKSRWYVYSFATLVAFSRVYVGVHYPIDIFAGALLGVAIGFIVVLSADYLHTSFSRKKAKSS